MDEFEMQRLKETGYHIHRFNRKIPYQIYLEHAKSLKNRLIRGRIDTLSYSYEIQLLMMEYEDVIAEHAIQARKAS